MLTLLFGVQLKKRDIKVSSESFPEVDELEQKNNFIGWNFNMNKINSFHTWCDYKNPEYCRINLSQWEIVFIFFYQFKNILIAFPKDSKDTVVCWNGYLLEWCRPGLLKSIIKQNLIDLHILLIHCKYVLIVTMSPITEQRRI